MLKRRRGWRPIIGGSITVALFAAWYLYNQRPRERVTGSEGLDNPEVARGFGRVAKMPQMKLLRAYVSQCAVQMVVQGTAVDLGCGPGDLVINLARRAPELHVTGVDMSDEMLTQAETRAHRAGLGGRIAFRKGDVADISFPDALLDLVVSTLSLHHWRDPVAVLNEIARVLRPGGAFLVFDLRRDLALPFWMLLWFVTHVVVPKAIQRINEPLGSRNAAYTPKEAAHMLDATSIDWGHVTQGPLWLTLEGVKP